MRAALTLALLTISAVFPPATTLTLVIIIAVSHG